MNSEKEAPPSPGRSTRQDLEVLVEGREKVFGANPKLTVEEIRKAKDSVFMPTPNEGLEYNSETELFNQVRAFIVEHVELPADVYHDVSALFVLATWRVKQARNATYLNLLASHGNGKSTLCEILRLLCFKSIHSEGATRGAIIRVSNGNECTLILDESDNWLNPRDFDNPLEAVINAGYRRRFLGGGVLICEPNKDKKYEPVQLDSFGFKVIAGRNPLNAVLGSRCITIRMRKSNRKFPKIDEMEAWNLRKQLYTYQLRHEEKPLEHDSVNRIADGRLREIFEPLLAAAPTETIREHLITFANEEYERRRKEELSSDEATIARAVLEIADKEPRSTITIKEISDAVNYQVTNPKEQISRKYVGVLLKRHGFISEHGRDGNSIRVDKGHLEYLRERYTPEEKPVVGALEIILNATN